MGIHSSFVNVCGKIRAFKDEYIDVDVLINMEQHLNLKLFHKVLRNGSPTIHTCLCKV